MHSNKTVAEAMYANIKTVGMPQWSADDQTLATALQQELKVPEIGPRQGDSAAARRRGLPDEEKRTAAPTTSATSPGTSPR